MLHILYLYCIYVCGYIGGMAISLCMYICVWVLGDGNKFMYVCMYVYMCVGILGG